MWDSAIIVSETSLFGGVLASDLGFMISSPARRFRMSVKILGSKPKICCNGAGFSAGESTPASFASAPSLDSTSPVAPDVFGFMSFGRFVAKDKSSPMRVGSKP